MALRPAAVTAMALPSCRLVTSWGIRACRAGASTAKIAPCNKEPTSKCPHVTVSVVMDSATSAATAAIPELAGLHEPFAVDAVGDRASEEAQRKLRQRRAGGYDSENDGRAGDLVGEERAGQHLHLGGEAHYL